MHLKECILQYLQDRGKTVSRGPDNYNSKTTHSHFSGGGTKSTCSRKMTNRPKPENAPASHTDYEKLRDVI